MHIGAVYLDEAPQPTGAESPSCVATGIYAAQVPGGVDVDLLAATPQEFIVLRQRLDRPRPELAALAHER